MPNNSYIPIKPIGNHVPRNGFSLSKRNILSAPVGMLIPCYVNDLNPGDHFEIDLNGFTRTRPLNTAAFSKCNQVIEAFFVPYRLLWSQWQRFITGLSASDVSLSPSLYTASSQNSVLSVPSVKLSDLVQRAPTTDIFGYSTKHTLPYLLNCLGYGQYSYLNAVFNSGVPADYGVNPFRMVAYRKIYNDHFRNEDYEFVTYNSDSLDEGKTLGTSFLTNFQPHYALWDKDNVMSVIPTLLYDKVANNVNTFVGSSPYNISFDSGVNHEFKNSISTEIGDSENGGYYISTAQLRNAFALERLLEVTRRAGKDYNSQIAAHLGFSANTGDFVNKSLYIGGTSAPVQISEVLSTTVNDEVGLGDIGGKGNSILNGHISFDAKEHGVIMLLMHFDPVAVYESSSLSPFNRKFNKEDYFQPETMDLGYQPMLLSDLYVNSTPSDNNKVVGWTPRYIEYKTARDECFGEFERGTSLGAYVSPRRYSDVIQTSDKSINVRSFHINPNTLNGIFQYPYDVDNNLNYFQFDVSLQLSIKALRNMSVQGDSLAL